MSNSAIILDRDGTMSVSIEGVRKIESFRFIDGTFHALRKLQENFSLFIYTNQSGIGMGLYSEEDFKKLNDDMLNRLGKEGIEITSVFYCPHRPENGCCCRKPRTEFLEQSIGKYKIDRKNSYVIGDKTTDIKFGENAGMNTILVKTGMGGEDNQYDVKPMYIFEDLLAASLEL